MTLRTDVNSSAADAASMPALNDGDADRASILIVDDRPDKLLVYRTLLEELDQNLYTASSGDEALRQVLERDFAVILLDVNMPGLDGLETASLIRGRKKSAHTPIILVTADYGDELRMTKAYSLGAVDYIASPVVPEILRAKVRVFVELYLLAEQAKRQAQERIALAEEKAAREAAERASRRLAFLAEASGTLASSLDLEATLRELSRLVVPRFADVCIVSLAPGEGQAERHEMAWATSDRGATRCSTASIVGDRRSDARRGDRARARRPASPEFIERDPAGAPASRVPLPRGLTAHALMLVPLLGSRPQARRADARARSAGAPRSTRDTLAMVAELATRAATALDNALLFRKIQDEDQRKNEFLAMLAHELRNPLAPISNAVHILRVSEGDAGEARVGARADRPPTEAAGAPRRRPARRVADHARQDRAQDRSRRRGAGGGGGDRDEQADIDGQRHTLVDPAAGRRRCTSGAISRGFRRFSPT